MSSLIGRYLKNESEKLCKQARNNTKPASTFGLRLVPGKKLSAQSDLFWIYGAENIILWGQKT